MNKEMELLLYLAIIMKVVYPILLIVGAVICNKYYFKEGFYFFLFSFILQVNRFAVRYYLEWFMNDMQFIGSFRVGTLMAILGNFEMIVQTIIAFVLIWGLYKRFTSLQV
ncbi:hypothetical protein [Alkaliphilus metalliredigens]|uniref:hypothetical protein n=1 Tax=Alkaliphilus metalliredigens TaxID=208226 RepID=UPI0005A0CCEA|nr:hypothetical protein [Alkaliphilus metalliredigens]